MNTTPTATVADDVIREIGENVSERIKAKLGRVNLFGTVPLGSSAAVGAYANAISAYRGHKGVHPNDPQPHGRHFEVSDAFYMRRDGRQAYTTDELHDMKEKHPAEFAELRRNVPGIESFAKTNHEQADIVEIRGDKTIISQNKNFRDKDTGKYRVEFRKGKYKDVDHYSVPDDHYEAVKRDLESRKNKDPESNDGKEAAHILDRLRRSPVSRRDADNPYWALGGQVALDGARRARDSVLVGLATDIAVLAFGGVVFEVRDAYRNPPSVTPLERCERLLRTIWEKIRMAFKDRLLREIPSEIISGVTTLLASFFSTATVAIEKIVNLLRRLWMEFVAGKIRTLADVVSVALKTIFTAAGIAATLALEGKLSVELSVIPGGDIIAAILAAAVGGAMIAIGNRSIESVVRGFFAAFGAANLARARREEIERFCDSVLPRMIADRERLEELVDRHCEARETALDRTFSDLHAARRRNDIEGFLTGLMEVNDAYGKALPWTDFGEFQNFMADRTKTLEL